MTIAEFNASASAKEPPSELSPALTALWHDRRKEWAKAHAAAQEDESPDGAWVHAYLHRKEGDVGNARYWYAKAGRVPSKASLEDEAAEIVRTLLARTV